MQKRIIYLTVGLFLIGCDQMEAREEANASDVMHSNATDLREPIVTELENRDANINICEDGAIYEVLESGQTLVVHRFGTGMSSFTSDEQSIYGMALDFTLDNGVRGAIFGPMRSYMFATEVEILDQDGYVWQPSPADPEGFFRVLSDDGESTLFHFSFVKCRD